MNVFVSLRLHICRPQLGTNFSVIRDGKVACVKWMKHQHRVLSIGRREGGVVKALLATSGVVRYVLCVDGLQVHQPRKHTYL
jgi:hypothetical protein